VQFECAIMQFVRPTRMHGYMPPKRLFSCVMGIVEVSGQNLGGRSGGLVGPNVVATLWFSQFI